MDYYSKYLKYKNKYLELQKTRKSMKSLTGGTKSLTGGMLKEKLTYGEIMAILNKDKYFRLNEYLEHNPEIKNVLHPDINVSQPNSKINICRTELLMNSVHISGIFADNSPAFPDNLNHHYTTIEPVIRLYFNFVHGSSGKELDKLYIIENTILPRCLAFLGLSGLTPNDIIQNDLNFKRFIFRSILSREFFTNLYDETDDIKINGITFNPGYIKTEKEKLLDELNKENIDDDKLRYIYSDYDNQIADFIIVTKKLRERQQKFAEKFKEIMGIAGKNLIGNQQYPEFNAWIEMKKKNLCQILTLGDRDLFNGIFLNPNDDRINVQFYEMAKQIWCLKLLGEAFPYKTRPTIFFPQFGEKYDETKMEIDNVPDDDNDEPLDMSYCKNKTVFCTIFPLLKIDSFITKAHVLINYNDPKKKQNVIVHDITHDLPENMYALNLLIQKENDNVPYKQIGDYWKFPEKIRTLSVNLHSVIKPSPVNEQYNIPGPSFDAHLSQIKKQSSQIERQSSQQLTPQQNEFVTWDNSPSPQIERQSSQIERQSSQNQKFVVGDKIMDTNSFTQKKIIEVLKDNKYKIATIGSYGGTSETVDGKDLVLIERPLPQQNNNFYVLEDFDKENIVTY
jgi:hypothetical protein